MRGSGLLALWRQAKKPLIAKDAKEGAKVAKKNLRSMQIVPLSRAMPMLRTATRFDSGKP